jgi:hypothetical protein
MKENDEEKPLSLEDKMSLAFLVVVLLVIILLIRACASAPSHSEEHYAGLRLEIRSGIERHCEKLAKENLNFPSTAKFPWVTERFDVRSESEGLYELIISNSYTAQNAFGVKEDFWYYCESRYNEHTNTLKVTLFNNYEK